MVCGERLPTKPQPGSARWTTLGVTWHVFILYSYRRCSSFLLLILTLHTMRSYNSVELFVLLPVLCKQWWLAVNWVHRFAVAWFDCYSCLSMTCSKYNGWAVFAVVTRPTTSGQSNLTKRPHRCSTWTGSPYTLQWAAPSPRPQNCPVRWWYMDPPANTWFLGPPQPKWHLDRFVHFFPGLTTVTDRQTDHATPSVTVRRIYVVLWYGLIVTSAVTSTTTVAGVKHATPFSKGNSRWLNEGRGSCSVIDIIGLALEEQPHIVWLWKWRMVK